MSISPVSGKSQVHQDTGQTDATTPAPLVTPFRQQLDAKHAQTEAAHGHHHHDGVSRSATSSAATAASAAGLTPSSSIPTPMLKELS